MSKLETIVILSLVGIALYVLIDMIIYLVIL